MLETPVTVESSAASDEPIFGNIPLSVIVVKPQVRKRFNQASLDELAKSIKQIGVAQPILCRPLVQDGSTIVSVELVSGERRYRASQIAGKETIPAVVKKLTDAQAKEIQVIENLQREDVHPLEEAEGYEDLMKECGYTANYLAEKVGKSREYIYGRLKLCAMVPAARDAFYDGRLNASTALLIARMISHVQEKATKEIAGNGEPLPYRAAVRHLRFRYMLELNNAPFNITDAKLVKAAGSCEACPKRTGNQPELFSDVDGADVCTDPDCFASKRAAHQEKLLAAAAKKGIPIYEKEQDVERDFGEDAVASADDHVWEFDRVAPKANGNQLIDAVLPAGKRPEPVAYVKKADGKITSMYDKTALQLALEKAGICETEAEYQKRQEQERAEEARSTPAPKAKAQKEKQDKAEAAAELETKVRGELYKRIRAAAGSGPMGLKLAALRIIAHDMLFDREIPDELLADVYPAKFETDADVREYIDSAPHIELQLLMLDMAMSRTISVTRWDLKKDDTPDYEDEGYLELVSLARAHDIDPDTIRTELAPKDQPTTAQASDSTLAIGDRVRVKDDARGNTGKKRKVCGKEADVTAINGEHYTVKFGPKAHELVTNLTRDELEKLQPETASPAEEASTEPPSGASKDKTKKTSPKAGKAATDPKPPINPATAWPFPTGARP